MILHRHLPAFLVSAIVATAAFGQTPAPAAPATPDPNVPKHACVKAGEFPGGLASDMQRRAWQKEVTAYADCLKRFIADQKALADPHLKAFNAAVDEYNESVRKYNEMVEQSRSGK
jgi:hypothetical protein